MGTTLNQAFYFDHRTQQPVYRTQTDKSGHFKLEKIKAGNYNLVAYKNGYGWKYITKVAAANVEPVNIKLYPEIQISENITDYAVWEADRHYIITKDITLAENATLIVDRGAVIRFSPLASLTISGDLEVNGDENNPVIFTMQGVDRGSDLWGGIKATGTNAKTTLNFAKIENAQYGLSLKNAGEEIVNCLIKSNDLEYIVPMKVT